MPATHIEVTPYKAHEGDTYTFHVRGAPIEHRPGVPNRDRANQCVLYVESPLGNGIGCTIIRPDQDVPMRISSFMDGHLTAHELGEWPRHWTARLFRMTDFLENNDVGALTLASAVFVVLPPDL